MKTINPSDVSFKLEKPHLIINQSVFAALNGNIEPGTPIKKEPDTAGINAGVYSQFDTANTSGVLIRIAANGSTTTNASYTWGAVNVGILINHKLLRQPIGFHVVDADKDVRVYRTAAPDKNQITLAPTDNTANVTVYIF